MHIVQVYHSKVPISLYGGMERVIESLLTGFIELGHKVTLISYKGDYEIKGVNFIDLDRYNSMEEANEKFLELIPKNADIVHFHLPKTFLQLKVPYICTMHGNLGDDEDRNLLHDDVIFLCLNHAKRHGKTKYVFNGLDPKSIPLSKIKNSERKKFSFLGRASLKRKGLHIAKKIARHFKETLVIGGGNGFNWFGCYKFLGQVDNEKKFQMLGESKALLFPILWEEPFGLVMIEALFCGTPVFALNHGSVNEVLGQDGSASFTLVKDNEDELIKAMETFSYDISAMKIRQYAEKYFSHIEMCKSYLKIYEERIHRNS